jgi:hypothetical protein
VCKKVNGREVREECIVRCLGNMRRDCTSFVRTDFVQGAQRLPLCISLVVCFALVVGRNVPVSLIAIDTRGERYNVIVKRTVCHVRVIALPLTPVE